MSVWVTKSWSGRAKVAGGMSPLSFSAAGVGVPDNICHKIQKFSQKHIELGALFWQPNSHPDCCTSKTPYCSSFRKCTFYN
jgi:hypothetical protein